MNRTEVKTIDDLPELPFEKVLRYLSLEDRLKSRAVSRAWYHRINNLKVKSLCYSERPSGFIWEKSRLVSGAFARNFISSTRFDSFFNTFGQSILSNLKHLRLCYLNLGRVNGTVFAQIINSFGQLEELALFYVPNDSNQPQSFELNLPMLNSIYLKNLYEELTLDAPKLQKIEFWGCSSPIIVHSESVERLLTDRLECAEVKSLKNLKYLYAGGHPVIHSTLLSDLDQLKEIDLDHPKDVSVVFEQKERYGLADLKIYLRGLLLNGPDDPAIDSLDNQNELFIHLAENRSRLADEIPFYYSLDYSEIERVDPELAIDLVSKFTGLNTIGVDEPVQDIERFLNLLKNFDHITVLKFHCDQPQELFDRLPEHCAVQMLYIHCEPSGLEFLSRLNHLTDLHLDCSIDAELIRKLCEGLPFLFIFDFNYNNKLAQILIVEISGWTHPKRFQVCLDWKWTNVPDLDAAIQLVMERCAVRETLLESGQLESPEIEPEPLV